MLARLKEFTCKANKKNKKKQQQQKLHKTTKMTCNASLPICITISLVLINALLHNKASGKTSLYLI